MKFYTDIVTYRWTELDTLATLTPVVNLKVSPYGILSGSLPDAQAHTAGDYVDLPLYLSTDLPTLARFYRDGYTWIPIPPDVTPGDTLLDLFKALYAYDPVLFAHCDMRLAALDTPVNVVDAVKGIASGTMPSLKALTPFADLAQLHFEYWGNTDLRFAVFNASVRSSSTVNPLSTITGGLLSLPLGLPLPTLDPMSLLVAELDPALIPTEKNGASIQWVLAQTPVRGIPIAAAPAPKGGGRQMIVSVPPARIELDGWNRQLLEPASPSEMTTRSGKVKFRITLPRPAKSVTIEILRDGVPYYTETKGLGEFLVPGPHLWTWDGYSQAGVYDSNALRSSQISARVTTVDLEGRVAASVTSLGTGPDTIRWTEAVIDRKTKQATVAVYTNVINPSDIDLASFSLNPAALLASALPGVPGLASLPGAQDGLFGVHGPSIPGGPALPGMPDLSIPVKAPSSMDLDSDTLAMFHQYFVKESIERHWSYGKRREWPVKFGLSDDDRPENISTKLAKKYGHANDSLLALQVNVIKPDRYLTIDNADWELEVSCLPRSTDGMTIILADGKKDPMGSRSMNAATFLEGLPILDQYECTIYPKADVGAHELGHSILRELKGVWFSLTHKGTSTPGQDDIYTDPKDAAAANTGVEGSAEKAELAIATAGVPLLLGGSSNEYSCSPKWASGPDVMPWGPDVMLYFSDASSYYGSLKVAAGDVGEDVPIDPKTMAVGEGELVIDGRARYLAKTHAVPEDAVGLLWMTKVAFG